MINKLKDGHMGQKGYTKEEFVRLAEMANPTIKIIGEFINTSSKILIKCEHSEREIFAWQALKPKKYCCNNAYHYHRIPPQLKSLDERINQYAPIFNELLDFSNANLGSRQKLDNIKCNKHNISFSQWFDALRQGIGCPECGKENKQQAGIKMLAIARQKQIDKGKGKFISNTETKWLDSLNISLRQYWLADVKYRADGYDPETNTVYLYHGRFWHGCPDTYKPTEVHPILKVSMQQLYDQTLEWEAKIKEAGYNLIVTWGK